MFYIICSAPLFLGGLAYIAGMIQDKTEQQVLTRTLDLQKANVIALKTAEEKSHFLAYMSHELRTPLNGILGLAEVISNENLNSEQIQHLGLIKYSGEKLITLINEQLDFSKLEAGKVKINNSVFKTAKLIKLIETSFALKAELKGIKFHIEQDNNLPVEISSDETRIYQILNNLIGNAIKFTKQGHVTLKINHIEGTKDNQLEFIVTDTGIGMNKLAIDKLFIPYEQGDDETERSFGGTGLGLSIVQKILHLMNGDIIVSSEPDRGSTFKVRINYSKTNNMGSSEISNKDLPHNIFQTKYNYSILVVEDNLINQKVISGFLSKLGYKPDFALDGSEAVDAVDRDKYDIIFMDVMMPKMNGIEATKIIRKSNTIQELYIIALTANTSEEDRKTCIDAGMNDFLAKPASINIIKNAIIKADLSLKESS
jgi:CheY-like chemotaxis protein/nitrogen-specific signal transduction histidine kinase